MEKWRPWTEEEKQAYIERVLEKVRLGQELKESEQTALRIYKRDGIVAQRAIEQTENLCD